MAMARGRAADIAAVGGESPLEEKQEWDRAMIASAEKLSDAQQRAEAIAEGQKRNLGYGLYKALREHTGGWIPRTGGLPGRDAALRPLDGDKRALESYADR